MRHRFIGLMATLIMTVFSTGVLAQVLVTPTSPSSPPTEEKIQKEKEKADTKAAKKKEKAEKKAAKARAKAERKAEKEKQKAEEKAAKEKAKAEKKD
jgi:F0F1-type ATP synthase membrane subunit b/b'